MRTAADLPLGPGAKRNLEDAEEIFKKAGFIPAADLSPEARVQLLGTIAIEFLLVVLDTDEEQLGERALRRIFKHVASAKARLAATKGARS